APDRPAAGGDALGALLPAAHACVLHRPHARTPRLGAAGGAGGGNAPNRGLASSRGAAGLATRAGARRFVSTRGGALDQRGDQPAALVGLRVPLNAEHEVAA